MLAVSLAVASVAAAQTITITSDKTAYEVNEPIVITVVGDSTGGVPADQIFGRLRLSPFLQGLGLQAFQTPLTSDGGAIDWIPGLQQCGAFGCTAFNQSQLPNVSLPDQPVVVGTMVLIGLVPGTLSLNWMTAGVNALNFFGLTAADGISVEILVPPFAPDVDIKPDSEDNKNPINLSGENIPVAIFGTDTFDVLDIDPDTLTFGPGGAPPIHTNGPHLEDRDLDGLMDLLAHFNPIESGLQPGDSTACVRGELLDGTRIEGCDVVLIQIPSCGVGFEAALLVPPMVWVHRRRRRHQA
jgi:hypothetical protein